jgi:hypothetical protein
MTFDVTGHPLLSAGAQALDSAELAAHNRIAEQALGLAGAVLEGDDAEAAKDAVALQVNYQVDSLPDRDWGALIEERPFKWIEKNVGLNPLALRMAARLVGTGQAAPVASVKAPTVKDEKKPFAFAIT